MSLQTDLHCRKGCGFYGNPEWNWHCSKCWREHLRKSGSPTRPTPRSATPTKASSTMGHFRSGGGAIAASSTESPKRSFLAPQASFSKFEDKKKRQTIDKNFKQIFQGRTFGGTGKESPEKLQRFKSSSFATADKKPRPDYPPEVKLVSQDFATFLKQRLEMTGVSDISKQVRGLVEKVTRSASILSHNPVAGQDTIDDLSALVQDFYQLLQKRLETKEVYRNLSHEDVKTILDFSEKYVMICCYKLLFCPHSTNDEDKDLEIQNRIRNLNWLSTQDLKCPLDESSLEVRDLLNEAIHDILEVDGKMAPQDKLDCIVKCSKKVFDMLKVSNENPASADDFLPCLIYVCLKANPPRIQSNINFITRFCNENKLRMGEGGYFFANLCCAVSFIENMTAESISMDPEEFDSYISGRAVPPGSWRSSMLTCEGLQLMSQNVKTLVEIKNRLNRAQTEATDLEANMEKFQREIESEVAAVLSRTPFQIFGPKTPVAVDSESSEDIDLMKSLPPPLVPQSVLPVFDLTESSPASKSGDIFDKSCEATSTRLEDFWGTGSQFGDNSSLMSLDISNTSGTGAGPLDDDPSDGMFTSLPPHMSAYVGFSAQSFSIPSIACDSDLSLTPSSLAPAVERVMSPPESASPMLSSVASSSLGGELSSDTETAEIRRTETDDETKCHVSSSSGSSNDGNGLSRTSSSTSSMISANSSPSSELEPKPMAKEP